MIEQYDVSIFSILHHFIYSTSKHVIHFYQNHQPWDTCSYHLWRWRGDSVSGYQSYTQRSHTPCTKRRIQTTPWRPTCTRSDAHDHDPRTHAPYQRDTMMRLCASHGRGDRCITYSHTSDSSLHWGHCGKAGSWIVWWWRDEKLHWAPESDIISCNHCWFVYRYCHLHLFLLLRICNHAKKKDRK